MLPDLLSRGCAAGVMYAVWTHGLGVERNSQASSAMASTLAAGLLICYDFRAGNTGLWQKGQEILGLSSLLETQILCTRAD